MKKQISVGKTIAAVLLAVLMTFQITYVVLQKNFDDKSKNSVLSDDSDSFISKASQKLYELDSTFRKYYIGEIDDDLLMDSIMNGYIVGTEDKYAAYYNEEEYVGFMNDLNGQSEGIGVNVIYNADYQCIEIINIMPDSPALEAGLKVGDLIVYVGEEKEPVSQIGYYGAVAKLRGNSGTEAVFTVARGENYSEQLDFKIKRSPITEVNVYSHVYALDGSIGIIKIMSFDTTTTEQFKEALSELQNKGCEKFILDVRYNPGGELNSIVSLLDYLLPEGPIIRIFDADDNMVEQYSSDAECVDIPMAVLVNGSTASAAELFTSALKDYNKATIVGTTTYGKGCMQTTLPLSDGSAVSVTYRMYKPPFSESYHDIGIEPDISVELDKSLEGKNIYKITDEEDNQMKAAADELNKQ